MITARAMATMSLVSAHEGARIYAFNVAGSGNRVDVGALIRLVY